MEGTIYQIVVLKSFKSKIRLSFCEKNWIRYSAIYFQTFVLSYNFFATTFMKPFGLQSALFDVLVGVGSFFLKTMYCY